MHFDWWTLALQTVNVLVLIWLLGRFFFRPVMNIVAKRQAEANKLLSDAASARHEAAAVRSDAETARAEVGAEQDRLIGRSAAGRRDGEGKICSRNRRRRSRSSGARRRPRSRAIGR